jgi:hypothetical protein
MYGRRSGGYKSIGVCQQCDQTVFAPMRARYLGTVKQCKRCKNYDPAEESERNYFRKLSADYQMEVQGFVSTP